MSTIDKDIPYHQVDLNQKQVGARTNPLLILLVGYCYFIQGVLLCIPGTMLLVYPTLPEYNVLTIFAFTSSSFSFKFVIAPFLEKYTSMAYGKRKSWIVLGQIISSSVLLLASFFTHQQYQVLMALMMFVVILGICLQDVSLDAMAIKQLRRPHLAAMLQSTMQTTGFIVGGLVLLKLTSLDFARQMGFDNPISSPSTILKVLSAIVLMPTLVIHFYFHQTKLDSQLYFSTKSLLSIIKYYRVFFVPRTRYCRQIIMFLLFHQGFNFFLAGYDYELINKGFSRNTLNTISNLTLIPITIITILMSSRIESLGTSKTLVGWMVAQTLILSSLWLIFPMDSVLVTAYTFAIGLTSTFGFTLSSIMINSLPVSGLSGMFITMLASTVNFGKLVPIHLKVTGAIGWSSTALVGLILQTIIILLLPKCLRWVEQGQVLMDGSAKEQKQN